MGDAYKKRVSKYGETGARKKGVACNPLQIPGVVNVRPLPPASKQSEIDRYLNQSISPNAKALLNFKLSKQKRKEVQELV